MNNFILKIKGLDGPLKSDKSKGITFDQKVEGGLYVQVNSPIRVDTDADYEKRYSQGEVSERVEAISLSAENSNQHEIITNYYGKQEGKPVPMAELYHVKRDGQAVVPTYKIELVDTYYSKGSLSFKKIKVHHFDKVDGKELTAGGFNFEDKEIY